MNSLSDSDRILAVAVQACRIGAGIAAENFTRVSDGQVQVKTGTVNLVTETDKQAEAAIRAYIQSQFPGHRFVGEELEASGDSASSHSWLIDPIDGTTNYIHGMPHYAVSVAYAHDGNVEVAACLDVERDEMFTAVRGQGAHVNGERIVAAPTEDLSHSLVITGFYYERGEIMERTLGAIRTLFGLGIRGIRRSGSAVLDICWVASGRADAFFEYHLSPWDFAAAGLIAREAGARTFDVSGNALSLESNGVIAAAPAISDVFLRAVSVSDER